MMNRLKALMCSAVLACASTGVASAQELTMAVWVSSLEQAVVVVLGTPLLLRSLFGL